MSSACPLSNLTPEQHAALKRVAIVYFVVKGLQSISLIALMVYLTTSSQYRPRLTAIWCVSTIVLGTLANRYYAARMARVVTATWPQRTRTAWFLDFVLFALLATMLILSW